MKSVAAQTRKSKKSTRAAAKPAPSAAWLTEDRWVYFAAGALIGAVFVCYFNSLGNGFVFDDHHLVLVYSRPKSFSHFIQMMTSSYRPLRNLSYAIDFWIWGERPFGFHLTNVLIHAANTVLVFLLVRRMTTRLVPSFFAALLFAVHPIQTDAVTYISGRRDILFTLFYLGAFLSYLGYRRSRSIKHFVLFLALWAFSLMSKEMAASLPLVIFLWNFCESWGEQTGTFLKRTGGAIRQALKRDRWLYIVLIAGAAALAYYAVFYQGASGRIDGGGVHYWGGSFYATMLTMARVHAWYLKQLIFPTPIAQYFGVFDASTTILDWRVLASIAVVGAVIAAGVFLLKKDRLASFAILSYFAMLAPVSQIIPHHELTADHYLYLPIASFALLVALAAIAASKRGRQARQTAYAVVMVFAIALAVMTVFRNRDWKDDLAVWQANYEAVPNSPRAAYNLGGLYLRRDPQRAEALLKQSLEADPSFEPNYLTLARLYVSQKRIAEAEEMIQKGIELTGQENRSYILRNPLLLRSQFTSVLAAAKWESGSQQETERLLREAVDIYPLNMEAYDSLSNYYRGTKERDKEEALLKRAIAVNASYYPAYARLVAMMIDAKRYEEAGGYLQSMSAINPSGADCRKAVSFIASAKSSLPASLEYRFLADSLRAVEQRCSSRQQ